MGRPEIWSDVFLGLFLVGLLCTVGMFFLGFGHEAGHGGGGHGHGGQGGHASHAGHGHGGQGVSSGLSQLLLPALNVSSLLALFMGAGAAGYVTLRVHGSLGLALGAAAAAGLVGAWAITQVLRLLGRAEAGVVRTADLVGTTARVIAPIGARRVGEIVFTRDGARRAMPARFDEEGEEGEIARDDEVIVLRVERGTAYVKRTSELLSLSEKAK